LIINTEGKIKPVFHFICQGPSQRVIQLLLKQGVFNKELKRACAMPREIRIAYIQRKGAFEIDDKNEMVTYPFQNIRSVHVHELLSSFFSTNNLTPFWINANGVGQIITKDDGTRVFDGAVGMVSR
jgi:hypothetical protein